ncbi:MAG: hypothetical protein U5L01_10140 [Rheinheimera sp.]|nr:hypothetical protein [Rheinheimera sp.]
MIRWLKGGLKLAFALVMVAAIIYPFMQENPIQEAKELEVWQVPSKLSALDKADQKKLLAKLTYPDHMPALKPVPDFSKFTDGLKKKKPSLTIWSHLLSVKTLALLSYVLIFWKSK